MKTLCAIGVSAPNTALAASPLYLVCVGDGTADRMSVTTGYAFSGRTSAWGQAIGTQAVPYDDQVNVEILDNGGRMRVPHNMLPPIHGGNDGWFELRNLKITDSEISGNAATNILSAPKFRIDRITGRISLHGRLGDYSGICQPYDPATAQRKF